MAKTSNARGSTVAHMHHMLATATAVATVSNCSRTDVQGTVTITPLPTVPASTDPSAPPPPPTASATFTAQHPSPPPPPPDPSGYLVVDMLPAPARCMGISSSATASASFHRDGAAGLVIDLVVKLPSNTPLNALFTGAAATAWAGQIMSSTFRSNATTAIVRIRPSGSTLGISLPVSCGSQGVGTLGVNITYVPLATQSTPLSLSMHDY